MGAQNRTGIKHLSLSTNSKNDRGKLVKRYLFTYADNKKVKSKSFYFGENVPQQEAFLFACNYGIELGLINISIQDCLQIFDEKKHPLLALGVRLDD